MLFSRCSDSQIRQPPVPSTLLQLREPPAREIQERHCNHPHEIHKRQVVSVPIGCVSKKSAVEEPSDRFVVQHSHYYCERVNQIDMQNVEEHGHAAEGKQCLPPA